MNPRSDTLRTRQAGSALASAGDSAFAPARVPRQTAQALTQLRAALAVAEAAVTARARLIAQASRASLRTSSAIWGEAEMLAAVSPHAAEALSRIANASTVGLTNSVLDASE